jgi:hypothetical protein
MENWQIAITCTFPHEAHMVKGYLESYGIESILKDELTIQLNTAYSNAIGGVKLLVRESDYEKTIKLLKTGGYLTDENAPEVKEKEIPFFEYHRGEKKCPFCSSGNIGAKKSPNLFSVILSAMLGFLAFAAISPLYKTVYKCFDCDRDWKYKKF